MAQVWTTIWHYVFREQVRILCMTQRFGEFPFLEHSVTTWNRGNEWMRPRVSVHLVNVIKVYFLLLLKILIESCISFLHLPHWTIGPFHAARFGKYWSAQFLCLQGFGTCCSLLDHSALPTPFNRQLLLLLQVLSAILLPHGDIPRSSLSSHLKPCLCFKLSWNPIAFPSRAFHST